MFWDVCTMRHLPESAASMEWSLTKRKPCVLLQKAELETWDHLRPLKPTRLLFHEWISDVELWDAEFGFLCMDFGFVSVWLFYMLCFLFGINTLKDTTFFLDPHLRGFELLKKLLTFRVLEFLRFFGAVLCSILWKKSWSLETKGKKLWLEVA